MTWVRAIVYISFKEGTKKKKESLYVALDKEHLIRDAQKAVDGWADGMIRLHRRNVNDVAMTHVEYQSPDPPYGWLTVSL